VRLYKPYGSSRRLLALDGISSNLDPLTAGFGWFAFLQYGRLDIVTLMVTMVGFLVQ